MRVAMHLGRHSWRDELRHSLPTFLERETHDPYVSCRSSPAGSYTWTLGGYPKRLGLSLSTPLQAVQGKVISTYVVTEILSKIDRSNSLAQFFLPLCGERLLLAVRVETAGR